MKLRHSIAYAYPTSNNANALGFGKTGCYYIEESMLQRGGTWSAPYIAHGCEGFASKDNPDLQSLLREYRGVVNEPGISEQRAMGIHFGVNE